MLNVRALTPGPSPTGEGRTALGFDRLRKPLSLWERGWGEGEPGTAYFFSSASISEPALVSRMNQQTTRVQAITQVAYQ